MPNFMQDVSSLFTAQLFLAAFCGMAFGLERQLRGKPFGVRTCILICVGTMLFVSLGGGFSGEGVDSSRVLGQVITGIGFIGAGAILSRNGHVKGITSAAVVWLIAGVGASIGLGRFGTAIVTTAFGVTTLFLCQKIEKGFKSMQRGVHKQEIEADE
ncbi:MAG: MgtC/SapB family protein [Bdellovibrionota bacterium]